MVSEKNINIELLMQNTELPVSHANYKLQFI